MEKTINELQQIPGLTFDYDLEPINIINSIQSVPSVSTMTDAKTTQTEAVIMFK